LRDEVAKFAGVLAQGVEKGDRVIIYMPMIAEAAMAMLACARIGAVHSVVFGGFAAKELATRINDAKPKVIVSASCGIEVKKVIAYKPLLDAAIDMSRCKPDKCVIVAAPHGAGVHDRRPGRGLGGSHGIGASRPTVCRWRPRIRCIFSTPRAPPASPRAWSGTTAATWWR
jgi:propionyl-CoA synthetase